MIVQHIVPWARSHLLSTCCHATDIHPWSFHPFTISSSWTWEVVEQIRSLAQEGVGAKVEFWDHKANKEKDTNQLEMHRQGRQAYEEIDRPLADNVIWYDTWLLGVVVLEGWCKYIVHVCVAKTTLVWLEKQARKWHTVHLSADHRLH